MLFNVDENHPQALGKRGMFEAPQLFCQRCRATSEANIKRSSGLKPCGETAVDVRIFVARTMRPQLGEAIQKTSS